MPGIRAVVLAIAKCNPPPEIPVQNIDMDLYNSQARGLTDEQMDTFSLIVMHGVPCFNYFCLDQFTDEGELKANGAVMAANIKADKDEAIEGFAGIL
jgi:hypothetical protein